MTTIFVRSGLTLCLLLSGPALLAQAPEPPPMGWSGKGEFGFVSTSGNSETESLNLALEFIFNSVQWRHTLSAAALYAEDDGRTTAERYALGAQSDYRLNERSYLFGALRHENDDFSAYEDQTTASLGYGRHLLDNDVHKLRVEGGLGYRTATLAGTSEDENGAIARGLLDWIWQITPSTQLTERFLVEAGSDNTFLQNDLGVAVAINARFALKAGYQVRHNTESAPGIDDTDTLTSINLVYNF